MSKHKAGGGKASQHVSPDGKRLGVKVANGQKVQTGSILLKQNGSAFKAGKGVKMGRDFTLYSITEGFAKFGQKLGKRVISVIK